MTLQDIIDSLELSTLTEAKEFSTIETSSGYASDLLSCVMAGAQHKGVWITLQAHSNIVAVAALLDLSAVIITEGAVPDQVTLDKANDQEVVLLASPQPTFVIAGRLWEMGLRSAG
jgi:hypothetical protein